MRPMIGWPVVALVVAAGCTSVRSVPEAESGAEPARYAQKLEDEGVVAVPNNSAANRLRAIALIERHVGADYDILSEGAVVKGSERELENRWSESTDTEYQIHYWKRGVWRRGANSLPALELPTAGLGYVDRSEERGVIALPDGSKANRARGLALIEKHLGSGAVIVQEGEHEGKHYIFYRTPGAAGWEPAWSARAGRPRPVWIKGGIY
jgi:uncharacterized protein YceK